MKGLFNEWALFWVTGLKDKPHIIRRPDVSLNALQFQSENGKQPLALTFSLFTVCNVFRFCRGVCLIHFSGLVRLTPSHFLFALLL